MSNTNIEGIQTIVGDVIVAKDGNGNLGNLTVQGTLFCDSISAESLPGTVYTTTLTGTGQKNYQITHNLASTAPSVTLIDNNGNTVVPSVEVLSLNQVLLSFFSAVSSSTTYQVTIRK